jgi:hypothetical protein
MGRRSKNLEGVDRFTFKGLSLCSKERTDETNTNHSGNSIGILYSIRNEN